MKVASITAIFRNIFPSLQLIMEVDLVYLLF